jgi:hypothetical protein
MEIQALGMRSRFEWAVKAERAACPYTGTQSGAEHLGGERVAPGAFLQSSVSAMLLAGRLTGMSQPGPPPTVFIITDRSGSPARSVSPPITGGRAARVYRAAAGRTRRVCGVAHHRAEWHVGRYGNTHLACLVVAIRVAKALILLPWPHPRLHLARRLLQ